MNQILDFIAQLLRYTVKFLLLHFAFILHTLWKAKDDISGKNLAGDFLAVLRSVGMFLFLNIAALFVFIMLPQGRDILLIIAEEVGVEHQLGNLLWLLLGLIMWSVVSEFAARYSIYVTDNTGKSLTEERIVWRKAVQKAVADIFLLLPFIVVLIAMLINYLQDESLSGNEKNIGYGVPALIIYLIMNAVAMFYVDDNIIQGRLDTVEDKGLGALYRRVLISIRDNKRKLRKRIGRTKQEKDWCEKLYGIYNDYVFALRKETNYTGDTQNLYAAFTASFNAGDAAERTRFPKDPDKVDAASRVPLVFELRDFEADTEDWGVYKWIYCIPNVFYRRLHMQVALVAGVCIALFIIICFLPNTSYTWVGAPGLLMLAFACWTGIYLALLYLDYAVFRNRFKNDTANRIASSIPVRFLLLVLLLLSSVANNDHPVRYNEYGHNDRRPRLSEHFTAWATERINDTTFNYFCYAGDTCGFLPVVFVCAEGGALRTGAYTSVLLSFLQDNLQKSKNVDLKKYIYAFSSVSGGSLGVTFFNTLAYLNRESDFAVTEDASIGNLKNKTFTFYSRDFLAPIIGTMFYGDLVALFCPFYIERFDRAAALEKSWESAFDEILNKHYRNYFSADFLNTYSGLHRYPALFINTTEVETGLQGWICNVVPDSSMAFAANRDILGRKLRGGINVSTAVNFSTRFPLFSPAAAVHDNNTAKWHYVDGGYVENTGAATMHEVIMALRPSIRQLEANYRVRIKPFVVMIRYSNGGKTPHTNINFANELAEILLGFMNTRGGRSDMANALLTRHVEQGPLQGRVSQLYLDMSGNQVPMNWVLSRKSLQNIDTSVMRAWRNVNSNDLRKLFALDSLSRPFPRYHDTCNCYDGPRYGSDRYARRIDSLFSVKDSIRASKNKVIIPPIPIRREGTN